MGIINKLKINFMRQKKSFTLIEMIVVIATIGLVLPALFTIIFSILQQQVKIKRLSIVKREGDYVLNIMENIIRNYGESIHSDTPPTESNKICQSSSLKNASYFKDKFGNWFSFCLSDQNGDCNASNKNYIASNSSILNAGNPGTTTLNSSQTKISNFNIQCYRTALYSPPLINISFTISYNTSSSRAEETASFNYQTKVKLRSY
jgi:type II secretory pathway pseudopilin PulG